MAETEDNLTMKKKITLTERSCMGCGQTFESTGKGNRYCEKCRNKLGENRHHERFSTSF